MIDPQSDLGAMTMYIADIVVDAEVMVFEPNPRTAEAMRTNLALNERTIAAAQQFVC